MDSVHSSAKGPLGVAAKGIVRRGDGSVLIIKRSPQSKTDPECWDLPGGKMDYGERLDDALAREVREETGLKVVAAKPFNVSHFVKEPFWITSVTFVCEVLDEPVHLSSEHVEHAWISLPRAADRPYARGIAEQLDAFVAWSTGVQAAD